MASGAVFIQLQQWTAIQGDVPFAMCLHYNIFGFVDTVLYNFLHKAALLEVVFMGCADF